MPSIKNQALYSTSCFFDSTDSVILKITPQTITITRPTLDYRGKTTKVTQHNGNWKRIHVPVEDSEYVESEDSDEDTLVLERV